MATENRLSLTPQFIIGMCLILFGVLLTFDRMQLIDAGRALRFWPVVLIALGAWIVIDRGPNGRTFPGYAMMFVGALWLLEAIGLARVRFWELFWPLLIVFIGARLIMHTPGQRRLRHHFRAPHDAGTDSAQSAASTSSDGTVNMFSVLGSDKRASSDARFRGGEVTSIVGGTQLDLRQATIEPGTDATVNIFAFMGGCELWVPQGWTVAIEVMPVLGSVEDKRLPPVLNAAPPTANGAAPRLVLRGVVVLGGLTIKN